MHSFFLSLFLYVWFSIYNEVPEDVHVQNDGPSWGAVNSMQTLFLIANMYMSHFRQSSFVDTCL